MSDNRNKEEKEEEQCVKQKRSEGRVRRVMGIDDMQTQQQQTQMSHNTNTNNETTKQHQTIHHHHKHSTSHIKHKIMPLSHHHVDVPLTRQNANITLTTINPPSHHFHSQPTSTVISSFHHDIQCIATSNGPSKRRTVMSALRRDQLSDLQLDPSLPLPSHIISSSFHLLIMMHSVLGH